MPRTVRVSTAAFAVAVIAVATHPAAAQSETPRASGPPPLPAVVQWHGLPSGGQYAEIKVGTGATPQEGQTAVMHFTGWLENGSEFDSTRKPNKKPFGFKVGSGQVIVGWDEGIRGMRVDGKRRLVIPPSAAYGARGIPGVVPPNATLIFDIELLHVIAN